MTKTEATKRGKELLARMKGKGWKLEVWENIGWHYAVVTRVLRVFPGTTPGEFMCLLGDGTSGKGLWHHNKTFADPNEAVRYEVEHAQQVLDDFNYEHQQVINKARSSLD